MKISRYAGFVGFAVLSLVGLAAAQTGTVYQTTQAPKIVHPYYSGLKVATDSDTPLDVTLTDTAISIPAGVSATLTDTSINDGGGSITIDNSNIDTAISTRASEATLAALDAKVTAVDTSNLDTSLNVALSELARVLNALDAKVTTVNTGAVAGSVTATIADSTLTDTWYDLTLTDTATEYSFTLPTGCVGYEFQCRTSNDVRWGNTAEVATKYWTLKSGTAYSTWPLANYNHSGKTLYFYSPTTAGLVIEIHAIIKP